jgi:hypothetical protein
LDVLAAGDHFFSDLSAARLRECQALSRNENRAKDMFIYILAHRSPTDAEKNWNAFKGDRDWISVNAEWESKGGLAKNYSAPQWPLTASI